MKNTENLNFRLLRPVKFPILGDESTISFSKKPQKLENWRLVPRWENLRCVGNSRGWICRLSSTMRVLWIFRPICFQHKAEKKSSLFSLTENVRVDAFRKSCTHFMRNKLSNFGSIVTKSTSRQSKTGRWRFPEAEQSQKLQRWFTCRYREVYNRVSKKFITNVTFPSSTSDVMIWGASTIVRYFCFHELVMQLNSWRSRH